MYIIKKNVSLQLGTAAEESSLFKVANRQHVKNAVEVSEYNVAANLFEMRSGSPWKAKGNGGSDADVINAFMPDEDCMPGDGDGADGASSGGGGGSGGNSWEGSDGAEFAACWKKLKVTIVGPENFEKNFAARATYQGLFDVVVVGAWQVQRVTPALGATAKRRGRGGGGGVMILEDAKYFVFMDKKASTEFAVKSSLLADAAGFAPVPAAAAASSSAHTAAESAGGGGDVEDENKKAPHPVGPGILPDVDDAHRFFIVKPAAAA